MLFPSNADDSLLGSQPGLFPTNMVGHTPCAIRAGGWPLGPSSSFWLKE